MTEDRFVMGEEIKRIALALAQGENAQSLAELVERTHLPVASVAQGIDLLVAFRLFKAEPSYHASEVGSMVYMFADNDNAQTLYNVLIEEAGEHQ